MFCHAMSALMLTSLLCQHAGAQWSRAHETGREERKQPKPSYINTKTQDGRYTKITAGTARTTMTVRRQQEQCTREESEQGAGAVRALGNVVTGGSTEAQGSMPDRYQWGRAGPARRCEQNDPRAEGEVGGATVTRPSPRPPRRPAPLTVEIQVVLDRLDRGAVDLQVVDGAHVPLERIVTVEAWACGSGTVIDGTIPALDLARTRALAGRLVVTGEVRLALARLAALFACMGGRLVGASTTTTPRLLLPLGIFANDGRGGSGRLGALGRAHVVDVLVLVGVGVSEPVLLKLAVILIVITRFASVQQPCGQKRSTFYSVGWWRAGSGCRCAGSRRQRRDWGRERETGVFVAARPGSGVSPAGPAVCRPRAAFAFGFALIGRSPGVAGPAVFAEARLRARDGIAGDSAAPRRTRRGGGNDGGHGGATCPCRGEVLPVVLRAGLVLAPHLARRESAVVDGRADVP
ncbi:hypothetical protein B0H21DRAFT_216496 [Amylocystis lapponica]|nr:hypothetical protein B0H21DRAFT_216496 [Amylocystis lapponica]